MRKLGYVAACLGVLCLALPALGDRGADLPRKAGPREVVQFSDSQRLNNVFRIETAEGSVAAYGDTYDITMIMWSATSGRFAFGGGTGLTYDGTPEMVGTHRANGDDVWVTEVESDLGGGFLSVMVEISTSDDLLPAGVILGDGSEADEMGVELGTGNAGTDPLSPLAYHAVDTAQFVLFYFGGSSAFGFPLESQGSCGTGLTEQTGVGGANGLNSVAIQLRYVIHGRAEPVCGDDIAECTESCDGTDDADCAAAGTSCDPQTCACAPPACDECEGRVTVGWGIGNGGSCNNCYATTGVDDPDLHPEVGDPPEDPPLYQGCTGGSDHGSIFFEFVALETSAIVRTDLGTGGTDSGFYVFHPLQSNVCIEAAWFDEVEGPVGCSEDDAMVFTYADWLGYTEINDLIVGDTYIVMVVSYGASAPACGEFLVNVQNVPKIPTLPQWGLVGLAALLLAGGAVLFRRRPATA